MKLSEEIRQAVDNRDYDHLAKILIHLRYGMGLTRDEVRSLFVQYAEITDAEFDGILYALDAREPRCS